MTGGGVEITVNLGAREGRLRPLHGVNNGPICFGGLVDLSSHHRSLEIPMVRLHDCEWPHPAVVDIPAIFPDLRADLNDPASYHFEKTDDYVQSIVDVGAQIIYRLGTSIEHTARKYHTDPPQDMEKWADICVHVIRHYNEGWAEGFEHGIRYWEIWNEPDLDARMWSGTRSDYLRLYAQTARAIKAHDPALKVGGPAAAFPQGEFLAAFVEACRRQSLPFDFCSWHTYTQDPFQIVENARHVRALLDRHGFHDVESHLNEWNYGFDWQSPESRRRSFAALQGAEGGSFAAAVLMLLQRSPVDAATYYTGDTSWFGLFDPYGVPRKTYHAFRAFVRLLETPYRVACETQGKALVACAGTSETPGTVQVLLSNHSPDTEMCRVRFKNGPHATKAAITAWSVDREHDLAKIQQKIVSEPMPATEQSLPGHSVRLIRLETVR